MDRHEHNFGFLRDAETGKTLGMAPFVKEFILNGYKKILMRIRFPVKKAVRSEPER